MKGWQLPKPQFLTDETKALEGAALQKSALDSKKNASRRDFLVTSWSPMPGFFPNTMRPLSSFCCFIIGLIKDGLYFFRPAVRSHPSRSAEILFLPKQRAFYEERETQQRPLLSDSARASVVLWSRLFDELVTVKPEGIPEPGSLQSKHFSGNDCKVASRTIVGGLHHECDREGIAA